MEMNDICDQWIQAVDSDYKTKEGYNHWSVDYIGGLHLEQKYEELWEMIKILYPKKMKALTFAVLAAGSVEELLSGAGKQYIDRIESLAKNDERFNQLLGGVWKSDIDEAVWERVEAVRKSVW